MLSIIEDLQSYATPAPIGQDIDRPMSVAFVAGHGSFDDPVSAMLVQLLGQRGVAACVLNSKAVSRATIASLDLIGIDVIAISYLQLEGSPAHLRYLVRRLRGRAPDARIVVGLWPQGKAALSDAATQQALGADTYVGSLAAAIDDIAPTASALAPTGTAA